MGVLTLFFTYVILAALCQTSQGQKNNVVEKPKSDSDALHEVKQAIADDSYSIDNLKRGFDYEPLDQEHRVNDFISNSNWSDYI